MKLSYDYEDLIEDFKSDIEEHLLGDTCWIIRGEERMGYSPIIDYCYDLTGVDGKVELAKTQEVLREMIKMNQII